MPFTAEDLAYTDYKTDIAYSEDDSRVSGPLDQTILNRKSSAEVLYFINVCYRTWGWPEYSRTPGRKIEKLLRHYIFSDILTQRGAMTWITQNWRHYWHLLPGK